MKSKYRSISQFNLSNGRRLLLTVKLLLFLFFLSSGNIFAGEKEVIHPALGQQQLTITGTIADETGEPMPGVNVVISGTTTGVTSDMDGKFTVKVPNEQTVLVITFVGYTEQRITVGQQRIISVVMKESVKEIGEVVVVGYGVQKKESVVGAITQVGNKDLVRAGSSNVTTALAGKLSGVLTMQQSGKPGDNDAEIIVRGLSSWNGSKPLVLVDGVERDFTDLDPNEINTISVLKDASATAVFGAKGANGVIIVTTKRGRIGKPTVDISASYGVETATRIPDHIDSYTTMSMYNYGLKNQKQFSEIMSDAVLQEYKNPSSAINSLRYPNVNWFDVLTKKVAPTATANFNITGGTDFVKYFCSLGYSYEGDLFKSVSDGYTSSAYKYHRLNYRANLDFALTQTTGLEFNIGGDLGLQNQPKTDPWRHLYQSGPSRFPAYFPAWALDEIPDLDYPDAEGVRLAYRLSEYTDNPYNMFNQGDFNQYTTSKLFTDLALNQKLDFITEGLSVKGKVSLSTYYKMRTLYSDYSYPKYSIDWDKIGTGQNPWVRDGANDKVYILPPVDLNVGVLEGGYYTDLYYELSLNYARTFEDHAVSGLFLFNRQQKNEEAKFPYYNEAWVGRATYGYANKYLFEVNLGYTGSERFAPSNRFGFFPSAAVGWVVSEERFFKNNISWMNKLKIRYSDGIVGSDTAGDRWLYQSSYFNDNQPKLQEDKRPNLTAQWETARKRDIGIELAFFDNLITFNVDFFDEHRENILVNRRSVTFLVGNTFKDMNLGETKKHGFEVEAKFNKTTPSGLNYYVSGIFGFNENRIIFKDDLPYAPEHRKDAGKPMESQKNGSKVVDGGYYTSVDDIHNYVTPVTVEGLSVGDYKFLDYSADGSINNMDQFPIKGNLYPPITYSFSGGVTYKNFEFNIMFQGNYGKYVNFNQIYETEFVKGSWRVHASQLDYWTPLNTGANHATIHYYGTGDNPQLMWGGGEADKGYNLMLENRYWRDASYLRLKEIYAGYTFHPKFLNNLIGVDKLLVYGTANNVLTFTNLIEGDPERKDFQQGFYPTLMSFKLGLKMIF